MKNWEFDRTNICSKTLLALCGHKNAADADSLIFNLCREDSGILKAILGCKNLSSARHLHLCNTSIAKESLVALVHHPIMASILTLNLHGNYLVEELADQFFKHLKAPLLQDLNLAQCFLTAK